MDCKQTDPHLMGETDKAYANSTLQLAAAHDKLTSLAGLVCRA